LKEWGYDVSETLIDVNYLMECAENGKLEEAWGTGTAAVISPIGHLFYKDKDHVVSNNQIGELTQKLYDELTGIQWGLRPDVRGWCYRVKV
jgi:branched-chain amino acid aminotransferase